MHEKKERENQQVRQKLVVIKAEVQVESRSLQAMYKSPFEVSASANEWNKQ